MSDNILKKMSLKYIRKARRSISWKSIYLVKVKMQEITCLIHFVKPFKLKLKEGMDKLL